jgi:hypothetical protein
LTYREHSEQAKGVVRTYLIDINGLLDELIGWMETAGYELDTATSARGNLRRLYNTLVVGFEESEQGTLVDGGSR